MMNKARVELAKADELRHVADKLWAWPSKQKVVLRFRGPIAVGTDVDSNEFEALRKEVVFAKVQGEAVGLANLQLAPNIFEGVVF